LVQQLKALAALPNDPGSILRTHLQLTTVFNYGFRGTDTLTHTYMQAEHQCTYNKKKIKKSFKKNQRAGKVAQQIRCLLPDDLHLIPRTHVGEGLLPALSSDLHNLTVILCTQNYITS